MKAVQLRIDKTLSKLGITRYELAKETGIRYQIIDNYYKNKVVRYDSFILSSICNYLNCDISDIFEIVEE
jgi:DNA-binding Xre family transcriptional regulator